MKKFLFSVILISQLFAAEVPVDINDDIYGFLRRMENKNLISLSAAVYPLSRNQIAEKLRILFHNQSNLTATEAKILREYLADYRYELEESYHENLNPGKGGLLSPIFTQGGIPQVARNIFSRKDESEAAHLFIYEKDDFFIWGDARFRLEQQWKNQHDRFLFSDRYFLQGGLNENLFFHIDFFRYQRESNPGFMELTREEAGNWSMQQPGGNVTFDNVYSSFVYHKNNLSVGLYHQPLVWGTSFSNSMILSGYAPPFTYLGFDYEYKALRFSFIHGSLLNDSTGIKSAAFETRNQAKYLAAHRIDLSLFGGTTRIGLSEMLIYGNRNIEPGYLLPVNFYWSIEHTLMDRDNSLMAFDFQTNIIPHFTVYGTFFLDEMRFGELFNDWWANKHGVQLGARFSHDFFSLPSDWQAEATFLRPWTYTHKFFINNYTSNGICLGFPYAGNSRFYELTTTTRFNRRTQMTLNYSFLKHGEDTETEYFGGDPRVNYDLRNQNLDNATKWLMGDIRTSKYLSAQIKYEVYNDAYLRFEITQYLSGDQNTFVNTGINLDF